MCGGQTCGDSGSGGGGEGGVPRLIMCCLTGQEMVVTSSGIEHLPCIYQCAREEKNSTIMHKSLATVSLLSQRGSA